MAKETLYLKIDGNVLVHQKNLTIKDIAQITCSNTSLKNRIQVLKLKDFHLNRPGRYVKSVVEVLDMIHAEYPEVEVENLGEADFIITYEEKKKKQANSISEDRSSQCSEFFRGCVFYYDI